MVFPAPPRVNFRCSVIIKTKWFLVIYQLHNGTLGSENPKPYRHFLAVQRAAVAEPVKRVVGVEVQVWTSAPQVTKASLISYSKYSGTAGGMCILLFIVFLYFIVINWLFIYFITAECEQWMQRFKQMCRDSNKHLNTRTRKISQSNFAVKYIWQQDYFYWY